MYRKETRPIFFRLSGLTPSFGGTRRRSPTMRQLPSSSRGCGSVFSSLPRRHYVFLPTSWTELQLRLRQKAQPTVLQVFLRGAENHHAYQSSSRRLRRRRVKAATRWAWHKAQRAVTTTSSVVPVPLPGRRGLWSRLKEMTGAGRMARLHMPRSCLARKRPFSREQVIPVTIEDHMESSWFDVKGRPLVARDATGRFVNPCCGSGANKGYDAKYKTLDGISLFPPFTVHGSRKRGHHQHRKSNKNRQANSGTCLANPLDRQP